MARQGVSPARVLDVGCGQGTQALALARAGHQVTGLDTSDELLAQFAAVLAREPAQVRERVHLVLGSGQAAAELTPGPFDVILCHGVLMYLDDIAPMLTALTRVAAPDAVLSLLVRNGLAPAMRDGLRGNWADALGRFDRLDYVNRLGVPAQAHTPAGQADPRPAGLGAPGLVRCPGLHRSPRRSRTRSPRTGTATCRRAASRRPRPVPPGRRAAAPHLHPTMTGQNRTDASSRSGNLVSGRGSLTGHLGAETRQRALSLDPRQGMLSKCGSVNQRGSTRLPMRTSGMPHALRYVGSSWMRT